MKKEKVKSFLKDILIIFLILGALIFVIDTILWNFVPVDDTMRIDKVNKACDNISLQITSASYNKTSDILTVSINGTGTEKIYRLMIRSIDNTGGIYIRTSLPQTEAPEENKEKSYSVNVKGTKTEIGDITEVGVAPTVNIDNREGYCPMITPSFPII